MMCSESMIKLIFMMMKLIVLMILKVHANVSSPLSSALTPLPTSLHPFELDNEMKTDIFICIESTLGKCEEKPRMNTCIGYYLFDCLFSNPVHYKDAHSKLAIIMSKCRKFCIKKSKFHGLYVIPCLVDCYEEFFKKD
jgi:hypothetical protein